MDLWRCGNCVVLLGAVSREPCIQLAPADWQTLLTHLADLSRDMCAASPGMHGPTLPRTACATIQTVTA